jgi:adenylate cyclase
MAKISLKNIVGKRSEVSAYILSLVSEIKADLRIEDENGKFLLGNVDSTTKYQEAIMLENELIGWVKGDEKISVVANLLNIFVQKDSEKKKLGSEVLNLYQEVNLIFNFSEILAQTIGALAIAQVALHETSHVITSDNGAVVLWDENSNRLQVAASKGELFFDETKINSQMGLLMKIILGGNSEILGDLTELTEAGIVLPNVRSIIYSALKVKHRIMGAILLASNEPVPYSAGDLKLLTTLALQSSSAIESALLYEKSIREANEREEAMRRIYEITGKFVPYEFIGALGHEVITEVRLGDQVEKIVTVLFSDIRNYTTLSEQMTPEENFGFVCSFNERMGPIIRKNKGFINQYLGDAIMAIFTGDASDALSAAVDMQQAVRQFNQERELNNLSPIQIGVGMHTGPLIMGITGDEFRLDATTISDTVNTASRIENLTKYYKASIIISDATLQQVKETENFHLRPLGTVQVKGKQEAVAIHECFSGNSHQQLQLKQNTLLIFNEAIFNYLSKSFEKAFQSFQMIADANPEDLTANFFLDKSALYMSSGVPENWIGVEKMQSK